MPATAWRLTAGALLTVGAMLAVAAGLGAGSSAEADTRAAAGSPTPVVLIGTAGLHWDDVSAETSSLGAVLAGGAIGSMVSRSVELAACPIDGWLAVSAGRRADAARSASSPSEVSPSEVSPSEVSSGVSSGASSGVSAGDELGCRAPQVQVATPGGPGTVTGWADYVQRARASDAGAVPGTLGAALAAGGRVAVAIGPGAAVAVADPNGVAAHVWPGLPATASGAIDPGADTAVLADQVRAALAFDPDLVVVDVGAIRDRAGSDRSPQVAALDDRLGVLFAGLPEDSTLALASLADAGTQARLQLAAASAPDRFPIGLLRSASTRQTGLIQVPDLLPTLLTALNLPVPNGVDGSAMVAVRSAADTADRFLAMLDLDQAATTMATVVTPYFVITLTVQVLIFVVLAWLASRLQRAPTDRTRRGVLTVLHHAAILGGCLPAATVLANLWPWWRDEHPLAALILAVVVAAVPLATLAVVGPWRHHLLGPVGVAGALTAAVFAADAATGSQLSLTALLGGQPLIGGRFYGFSNPPFAVFGAGLLFAALAAGQALLDRGRRRDAALAVAGIGAVAVVLDVLPAVGADFGGPPALIPAFALFSLQLAGIAVTWRRATAIALGTVAVLAAICVADWLRPAGQRTHLGRFVQTLLDGGGGEVVRRKAEQNLSILLSGPLTALLPIVAVLVVGALARPTRLRLHALATSYQRLPVLPAALLALGVMLGFGFALNDSGTSIPPAAMMVTLPWLVAICARVQSPTAPPPPGPRRR